MNQLGPEGRQLLNGGIGNLHTPQELDYLIDELRNPKQDTLVNKVLGYLYHYLPFVKREYNLRLIINAFLNNPTCFSNTTSFDESCSIIEVFKLISEKKLKISVPTLDIKLYYSIWLSELKRYLKAFPATSWRLLPIISGFMLSDPVRKEIYELDHRWFFYNWTKSATSLFSSCLHFKPSRNINYLSLLSLALIYDKSKKNISYYLNYNEQLYHFAISQITEMLFDTMSERFLTEDITRFDQVFDNHLSNPFYQGILDNDNNGYNYDSSSKVTNLYPGVLSQSRNIVPVNGFFNNFTETNINTPVVRYLNKLSFLLEALFEKLPSTEKSFELVTLIVKRILNFNQELNFKTSNSPFSSKDSPRNQLHQQYWFLMKQILFGQIIIFQGILTKFMKSNKTRSFGAIINLRYQQIGTIILHNLYYLNFILLSIGQGGFDSYNFVYYLSVDLSLKNPKNFQDFSMFLIGNYQQVNLNPQIVNENYLVQSKILFTFGLWENYLQNNLKFDFRDQLSNEKFKFSLFEITFDLANSNRYHIYDINEGAHSVLLIYFSQSKIDNVSACIKYVQLLFDQHPKNLSPNQLSIAIETIGKKILESPIIDEKSSYDNSGEEFLDFIYLKCYNAQSIPIKDAKESNWIGSGQPISEIDAPSTLSNLDKKTQSELVDVLDKGDDKPTAHIVEKMANEVTHEVKERIQIDSEKYLKYFPIPKKKEYEFEQRVVPETIKESAISTITNLLPYIPLPHFVSWLNKIWALIENSTPLESEFLAGLFWKVISEKFDINRSDLAYQWWYEVKLLPSKF